MHVNLKLLLAHLPRTPCNRHCRAPLSTCLSDSHQTLPHLTRSVHTCTCNHAHRPSSNSTRSFRTKPGSHSKASRVPSRFPCLTCCALCAVAHARARLVLACPSTDRRARSGHHHPALMTLANHFDCLLILPSYLQAAHQSILQHCYSPAGQSRHLPSPSASSSILYLPVSQEHVSKPDPPRMTWLSVQCCAPGSHAMHGPRPSAINFPTCRLVHSAVVL